MADGAKDIGKSTRRRAADPEAGLGQLFDADVANDPDERITTRLSRLDEAVRGPAAGAWFRVADDLMREGVRREDIHDLYIPALARRMGEEWCTDQISFANVTIGVARLQSLVREISRVWIADGMMDVFAPNVLLVVPENCFHTLGAVVLAGQLRRNGVSVRVLLDAHAADLQDALGHTIYDAVMLSCTSTQSLETARTLVEIVKNSGARRPKVMVGGSVLGRVSGVREKTGADVVTNDLDEALGLCGLKNSTPGSTLQTARAKVMTLDHLTSAPG